MNWKNGVLTLSFRMPSFLAGLFVNMQTVANWGFARRAWRKGPFGLEVTARRK